MCKVYLAGRYGRREELKGYADELEDYGIISTATWLLGGHDEPYEGMTEDEFRTECAEVDLADIDEADMLIAFTEPRVDNVSYTRGGRHVELGYAIAQSKEIHIIGPRENVFCHLEQLHVWESWKQFMDSFVRVHYDLDLGLV